MASAEHSLLGGNDACPPSASGDKAVGDERTIASGILKAPKKKLLTLATLVIITIWMGVVKSCVAPFFPKVATAKGLSQSQIGIVFGCFSLSNFAFAPLCARLVARFGPKRWLVCAAAIFSSAAVLFGLVEFVDGARWFFSLSLLCRLLESVGSGGIYATVMCMVAMLMPHNVNFAMSMAESTYAVGLMLGPAMGGVLYESIGYTATFGALGGVMLALAAAAALLVDAEIGDSAPSSGNLFAMLRRGHFAFLFIFGIVIYGFYTFNGPTLEIHLRPYDLSPSTIGLIFALNGLLVLVSSPIAGLLVDRYGHPQLVIVAGCCACVVGFLLLGPSPLLPIEGSLWLNMVALTIHGLGVSPVLAPVFGVWLEVAKYYGMKLDTGTHGCVSTAIVAMFNMSSFLFATFASVSVDLVGYEWTTTGVAGIIALATAAFGAQSVYLRRRARLPTAAGE